MLNGIVHVPPPVNEPVRSYAPGLARARLAQAPARRDATASDRDPAASSAAARCAPATPARRSARTTTATCSPPTTRPARPRSSRRSPPRARRWRDWSEMPWEERAAVFLKAADLLAGPWRDTVNAATMLGQSKTVYQAEIDAACELIDFWRFNAALHAARSTPSSRSRRAGMWNYVEYRAARGLRLRGDAVQLHRDRRQPADRAGADGQHRAVEAGVDRDPLELLHDAGCSRRRACRRA